MWEVLTEEERADLLGSVVQVVEMTDKESVTLELLPMPHSAISYSNRFELKSQMGAGRSRSLNQRCSFHSFERQRLCSPARVTDDRM